MLEIPIQMPARLASYPKTRQPTSARNVFPLSTDKQALRQRFDTIWSAFTRHGGVWDVSEVEQRLRLHVQQPISTLAHLIVERRIVTFSWGEKTWFPAFQFEAETMSLRSESQRVLAELASVYDDFDVAHWLAHPNVLLGDAAPVDCIRDHPCCVLAAARLDRFVAKG